jgi:hypothetical protein
MQVVRFTSGHLTAGRCPPGILQWLRFIPPYGVRDSHGRAVTLINTTPIRLPRGMRQADLDGTLMAFLNPQLNPDEREIVRIEGWILGVV